VQADVVFITPNLKLKSAQIDTVMNTWWSTHRGSVKRTASNCSGWCRGGSNQWHCCGCRCVMLSGIYWFHAFLFMCSWITVFFLDLEKSVKQEHVHIISALEGQAFWHSKLLPLPHRLQCVCWGLCWVQGACTCFSNVCCFSNNVSQACVPGKDHNSINLTVLPFFKLWAGKHTTMLLSMEKRNAGLVFIINWQALSIPCFVLLQLSALQRSSRVSNTRSQGAVPPLLSCRNVWASQLKSLNQLMLEWQLRSLRRSQRRSQPQLQWQKPVHRQQQLG